MDVGQKEWFTTTIAEGLVQASASAQARMLEQFGRADPDYAGRIAPVMGVLRQKG